MAAAIMVFYRFFRVLQQKSAQGDVEGNANLHSHRLPIPSCHSRPLLRLVFFKTYMYLKMSRKSNAIFLIVKTCYIPFLTIIFDLPRIYNFFTSPLN